MDNRENTRGATSGTGMPSERNSASSTKDGHRRRPSAEMNDALLPVTAVLADVATGAQLGLGCLENGTDGMGDRANEQVTERHSSAAKRAIPESDSSSESSYSKSPRSDNPDDGSQSQDESDSSIAVDCSAGPSEVIVKGRNVRKVRVKFPPQTPQRPSTRAKSGLRRRRQMISRETDQDDTRESLENLPYSQEETGSTEDNIKFQLVPSQPTPGQLTQNTPVQMSHHTPIHMSHHAPVHLSRNSSLPSSLGTYQCQDGVSISLNRYNYPLTDRSRELQSLSYDSVDRQMRHSILHGLDYFENRNSELHEVIRQLTDQLNASVAANKELERQVADLHDRLTHHAKDSDEQKIKLDQSEKENILLQEQAYSNWRARVKAEEMYVEVKHDLETKLKAADNQFRQLQGQLETTRTELQTTSSELASHMKKTSRDEKPNQELTLELMHQISLLKDNIQEMTADQDKDNKTRKKMEQDISILKVQLETKKHDLECQYKRFLSLKKSFNDLSDSHNELKAKQRTRKNSLGSNTWPLNHLDPQAQGGESETLHYIELPNKDDTLRPSPAGGKKLPPGSRHRRQASEGKFLLNNSSLPPVAKDGKKNSCSPESYPHNLYQTR